MIVRALCTIEYKRRATRECVIDGEQAKPSATTRPSSNNTNTPYDVCKVTRTNLRHEWVHLGALHGERTHSSKWSVPDTLLPKLHESRARCSNNIDVRHHVQFLASHTIVCYSYTESTYRTQVRKCERNTLLSIDIESISMFMLCLRARLKTASAVI